MRKSDECGISIMENDLLKKQDRRVLRTKRAIRNAFITLLAEKDFEKITIKEIADCADVDRKTVYNYYGGISAILEELENEFFATVEGAFDEFDFKKQKGMEFFEALSKLVEENLELYGLLMRTESNTRLSEKLVEYIKRKIYLAISWAQGRSHEKIDLAAEFVTAGILAGYRCWFKSDRKKPLKDFSYEMGALILGGLNGFYF